MDLITPTKKVVTLARIKVFVVRVPDHKDFIQNLVGAKTLEFSEKFKVSVPLKIAYVSLWSGTWTTKTLVALARIKVSVGGITLTHSGPGIPVFFSFALLCLWLRSGQKIFPRFSGGCNVTPNYLWEDQSMLISNRDCHFSGCFVPPSSHPTTKCVHVSSYMHTTAIGHYCTFNWCVIRLDQNLQANMFHNL